MNNPVWQWLIETRTWPYRVMELFDGPSSEDAGPGWCFARYGQSSTELPDGRIVLIAGEHEDSYDPDFYIYNDLVILSDSGQVQIYGYPVDVFPPTDFHTATLVDKQIVLIGSLGYPNDRQAGATQILQVELDTWRVSRIEPGNNQISPGWLHEHHAVLSEDKLSILVSGGKIDPGDGMTLIENMDDWRLDLEDCHWERLTNRNWPRFEVWRQDRKGNHLWEMRQLLWETEFGRHDDKEMSRELKEKLGGDPRLDILRVIYAPDFADEILGEDEDDHKVYRIRLGDTIVRYVEDWFGIQVTAEGELPSAMIQKLNDDLVEKFGTIELSEIDSRTIPNL